MIVWSILFVLAAALVGFAGYADFGPASGSAAQVLFWFLLAMGLITAALSTLEGRRSEESDRQAE